MVSHILIVDDDIEFCEMLTEYLETEDFRVDSEHDGERGAQQALSGIYDVIVLDVMLPKLNGFDALQRIRTESPIPILMLTARGDDVDRIIGLEMGADDYLPKPCNPRELLARLRALLRRSAQIRRDVAGATCEDILCTGDLEVHPASRQVTRGGIKLELTSTEYNLLEMLVRNAGRVVTKESLSEMVLGRKLTAYDRSIDMHISKLRRKLEQGQDGESIIQTVRGIGYQLIKEK
ncbi:MAG: response regulator transcription factor [Pseudomonadota bacterium]